MSFQLPLSGSRERAGGRLWRRKHVAFNSLSRDHHARRSSSVFGTSMTFNSLSRDHPPIMDQLKGHRQRNYLSTPSLGITFKNFLGAAAEFVKLSTPSLGITAVTVCVSLPLEILRSFNSLSRDHPREKAKAPTTTILAFNSLSRDHRARFRDFPALRGFLPRRPFAQMNFETTI